MSITQISTTPNAVTNEHPRPTRSSSSSAAAGTQLAQIMINYNKISQSPPMNGSTDWLNCFYDLMRTEWTRLRTFHARQVWSHRFITAEELANAGFFYTSNGDRVQCAFCRGVVSHWKSKDQALSEHSIHFPLCPFIMEMDVGNVPIGRDPIHDPKARHDVCGNMSSYEDMNSVRNSISINRRDADINALNTHISEFGVQPHNGPKNPEYNSIDARKRSYYINAWDQSIPVSTDSLAEAGFFSVGMSDYTKCFYCDGGLSNWEPGDEPWTQHAKWFPDCHFVVLNQSQAFVDQCRQMQVNEGPTNSLNENESDPEIYSDYDSDEESVNALGIRAINEWMNTDIVLQIMDINVGTVNQIKAVLNKRWLDVRQPYTSFAQLYDAVTSQRRSDSNVQNSINRNQSAEETHNSDDLYNSSSDDDYHSGGEVLPYSQPSLSSTVLSLSNYSSSPDMLVNDCEPSRVEDNRLLCKICLDREIEVVFLPCGHQLACTQCAPCVADCPICRKIIRGTVRTFFS